MMMVVTMLLLLLLLLTLLLMIVVAIIIPDSAWRSRGILNGIFSAPHIFFFCLSSS